MTKQDCRSNDLESVNDIGFASISADNEALAEWCGAALKWILKAGEKIWTNFLKTGRVFFNSNNELHFKARLALTEPSFFCFVVNDREDPSNEPLRQVSLRVQKREHLFQRFAWLLY
ncbi:hypothetical protein NPIL_344931 [Nephila pilipes]|uniref:Uncharacterized protein n=1 Tax=Nephila pilipes TaxID=299642 RepID=A0A8X6NIX1_NEPPI|nr:hypothetical protein NPIL_344931 [Nephila pilipes]